MLGFTPKANIDCLLRNVYFIMNITTHLDKVVSVTLYIKPRNRNPERKQGTKNVGHFIWEVDDRKHFNHNNHILTSSRVGWPHSAYTPPPYHSSLWRWGPVGGLGLPGRSTKRTWKVALKGPSQHEKQDLHRCFAIGFNHWTDGHILRRRMEWRKQAT